MPAEEDVLHMLASIERKMRLREAKVDSTFVRAFAPYKRC